MVKELWEQPRIFSIPVPMPDNPLRNLNVYVVCTEKQNLIIDTGFNRTECRDALWEGIRQLGLDLSKTVLFLTHLHSDHVGLVWDFVKAQVPVYMGRIDYEYHYMLQQGGFQTLEAQFKSEGFPSKQIALQSTQNQGRKYASPSGFPVNLLEDQDVLPLHGIEARVIHTPGHTPGHMVLYLPRENILFTGDHILFDISPNISVWPNISDPLSDYIASLKKTRALTIRAVFPAHRTAGVDTYHRIEQIIEHHDQRLREIYKTVAACPGCNAYEIAGRIKWLARGIQWENFSPHQKWFAMGETLAHLIHLTNCTRMIRRVEDGVANYYLP